MMGQAAVRTAVQAALQNASLPMVGTVYAARAYTVEQDYEINAASQYVSSANGSSAVIVVNLVGPDKRYRIADTGRGAYNDMNVHQVQLEVFFASSAGDPVAAQQDYDTVVDGIVGFVRATPTMGAPSSVWSAGEYDFGVVHTSTTPFQGTDGTSVYITGLIRFEAWEQLVGSV
jgi:hypothetical protein